MDSYDKLIAWLAEMAENDSVELDTSVFVSHLNRVCGKRSQSNHFGLSGHASSSNSCLPSGGGGGPAGNSGEKSPSSRQNSASCDSHVSHASSDATQRHKNSVRSDDFLDPKSASRSGIGTRQNTFSDDLEEDTDVKNASIESLYSSTDRDSELGSMSVYDATSRQVGRRTNFTNSSPLLKMTLAKMLRSAATVNMTCSSSTGNLNLSNISDVKEARRLPYPFIKRKSVSLLNLSHPEPIVPRESVPKFILTRDADDECDVSPQKDSSAVCKTLKPGLKSSSLTPERKKAKFERQFSLHSDSSASVTTASDKFVFLTTNSESPDKSSKEATAAAFLDDALLDGNIADILFSVEALWPKN